MTDKKYIMSGKSKINLEEIITKEELNEEMSRYVGSYRYYQRLIAIKFIIEGNTISDASKLLNLSYQTEQYIDGQKHAKKKDWKV